MDLVLLTGNGCPNCVTLKNRLEAEGLLDEVEVRNVHEDEGARELLMSLGLRSIPVLVKHGHSTIVGATHPIEKYKDFMNAEYY